MSQFVNCELLKSNWPRMTRISPRISRSYLVRFRGRFMALLHSVNDRHPCPRSFKKLIRTLWSGKANFWNWSPKLQKFIVKIIPYVAFIADFAIEVVCFHLRHYFKFQPKIEHPCFKVTLVWYGQQSNVQNYIDSKHLRTPFVFQWSHKWNWLK